MAFTAWSYAEMSRVVPHAGSVFAYATEGLGSHGGLPRRLAGDARLPADPVGGVPLLGHRAARAGARGAGVDLHRRRRSRWRPRSTSAGVRIAARAGFVVLVAEIAVLVVFVVSGLAVLATSGPARPLLSPFTGIDGVRSVARRWARSRSPCCRTWASTRSPRFAEETTGESREVGRAILFCLTVAGRALRRADVARGRAEPDVAARIWRRIPIGRAPTSTTSRASAIGPWLATLLAVTKAIGPAFAAMTGQAAAARLLFGMARDGRLPRALADVDARHGVPARRPAQCRRADARRLGVGGAAQRRARASSSRSSTSARSRRSRCCTPR